ncbi:hypothetical protein B7W85_03480 [Allorhizobium ampelinum]|nr:hypothetical protein B7W85_03480 [Allorhizobium ampelinum]
MDVTIRLFGVFLAKTFSDPGDHPWLSFEASIAAVGLKKCYSCTVNKHMYTFDRKFRTEGLCRFDECQNHLSESMRASLLPLSEPCPIAAVFLLWNAQSDGGDPTT